MSKTQKIMVNRLLRSGKMYKKTKDHLYGQIDSYLMANHIYSLDQLKAKLASSTSDDLQKQVDGLKHDKANLQQQVTSTKQAVADKNHEIVKLNSKVTSLTNQLKQKTNLDPTGL